MAEYEDLPSYERIPDYYLNSPQTKAIVEATTRAALTAREVFLDTAAQLHVATATWGLEKWEELLAITPDSSATIQSRRAACISKMLGAGTCDVDMIIDIARTITGLDCIVDERTAKYSFSLIFVGDELKLADFDQDDRDAGSAPWSW
jgi:uncharacterized protein YmfQ (DUF2313 family)